MLFAIVSDSHDNIPNIDAMLRLVTEAGVGVIIHCGDVCAPSVLKYISENFTGTIHLAYGNVDGDHETMEQFKLPNVIIHGEFGSTVLDGVLIAFAHFPDRARELAASGKYQLVFHGHTHKPWEERVGDCRVVNPGTLAGLFSKPTFALYDTVTKQLTLKLLYQ